MSQVQSHGNGASCEKSLQHLHRICNKCSFGKFKLSKQSLLLYSHRYCFTELLVNPIKRKIVSTANEDMPLRCLYFICRSIDCIFYLIVGSKAYLFNFASIINNNNIKSIKSKEQRIGFM